MVVVSHDRHLLRSVTDLAGRWRGIGSSRTGTLNIRKPFGTGAIKPIASAPAFPDNNQVLPEGKDLPVRCQPSSDSGGS
jgi:hypothetical protein